MATKEKTVNTSENEEVANGKKKVAKEPHKKVIWAFDKDTQTVAVSDESIKADNEKKFSFKLLRYKDSKTHEESLKIECYYEGNINGDVPTNLYNLDDDIKKFMRFGVAFTPTQFRDLRKVIEESYLEIVSSDISFVGDTRLDGLIDAVKEFVKDSKGYIDNDLCYIPVNDFNDLAEDCRYNNYELKSLRETLDKEEYIHTVSGRYAILKRIKDRPERVLAVAADSNCPAVAMLSCPRTAERTAQYLKDEPARVHTGGRQSRTRLCVGK